MKKHLISLLISILMSLYVWKFSTAYNDTITEVLKYDKETNYQTLELYLFSFFVLFCYALVFIGLKLDEKKE